MADTSVEPIGVQVRGTRGNHRIRGGANDAEMTRPKDSSWATNYSSFNVIISIVE